MINWDNKMIFFRSALFNLFLVFWTILIGLSGVPLLFVKSDYPACLLSKAWAKGAIMALSYICGLKLEIRGNENIPKGKAILACKHQSALETIVLYSIIDKPIFILRKSLFWLPFIGQYIKKLGMIYIDRKGAGVALKDMLSQAKDKIQFGYNIIIFPEGTRTAPGEKSRYNPGILALYKLDIAPVVPVALNTGLFWRKNAFLKYPGTYIISFLPKLSIGQYDKAMFMEKLQEDIEEESSRLLKSKKV
jgi:1-acyl-sn-glycerol-3-phosphate acyltransferase